jgi:hypothetical protein
LFSFFEKIAIQRQNNSELQCGQISGSFHVYLYFLNLQVNAVSIFLASQKSLSKIFLKKAETRLATNQ